MPSLAAYFASSLIAGVAVEQASTRSGRAGGRSRRPHDPPRRETGQGRHRTGRTQTERTFDRRLWIAYRRWRRWRLFPTLHELSWTSGRSVRTGDEQGNRHARHSTDNSDRAAMAAGIGRELLGSGHCCQADRTQRFAVAGGPQCPASGPRASARRAPRSAMSRVVEGGDQRLQKLFVASTIDTSAQGASARCDEAARLVEDRARDDRCPSGGRDQRPR